MKFPASPLLLGLALSSSTLAYPAPPGSRSPNPESSPLLEETKGPNEERAWGIRERGSSRLTKQWSRRQGPAPPADDSTVNAQGLGDDSTINAQSVGDDSTVSAQGLHSTLTGLTGAVGGIAAATPLGGVVTPLLGTVNGLVGGLLGDDSKGPLSALLGGLGLGGLLDTAKGTIGGLPIAGPILAGLLNNLNVASGSGVQLDQLQALLSTASTAQSQGLSIVANLGDGKFLTSAGTVLQLGQGTGGDPTSGLAAASTAAAGVFASMPVGTGDSASIASVPTTIPINTGQGIVQVPLSLLQGLLGLTKGTTGGQTGTGAAGATNGLLSGATGTLINVGGHLVRLSDVLGLLSGPTSSAQSNPFNMVGLATGTDDWADAYSMDDSDMTNSTETVAAASAAPSEDSGTPTATQLVTSMIARQLAVSPSDMAKVPINPSGVPLSPPGVAGKTPVAPGAVPKVPIPGDSVGKLPGNPMDNATPTSSTWLSPHGPPSSTSAAPTRSAPPVKAMEWEDEGDWEDDDAETESWGDFVDGN